MDCACNVPATFQRLMELVLSGLHWTSCLVYLDDIIIFSKTVNEHLRQLEEVLDCLRGAGLKAKPSKCQVFRKSVQYLEHVVSKEGIQVDFEKVRVVAQWPMPSCQQEIKKFLGFASYYRRFVPNFARVATPLYRLCEQNRAWLWDAECERAFCSLKQLSTYSEMSGQRKL